MTKLFIAIATYFQTLLNPVFISPIPDHIPPINQLTGQPNTQISYGFLPYWNLKYLDTIAFDQITHLAYFGLPIKADGTLDKQDLGYRRLVANSNLIAQYVSKNQLKFDLVIKNPNDEVLFSFLNNPSAHQALIDELSVLTETYSLSGINLDFEPVVATDSTTINALTQFVRSYQLTNQRVNQLTMDIYPSAASSPKLWDLSSLSPYVDYFVVMGYDYYRAGSLQSGPVSPLYPAQNSDRHAVIKNLAQISRQTRLSQIILGVPLYGYEWSTESDEWLSPALSFGGLATNRRITQLLREPGIVTDFNLITLTPRLIYTQNGQTYQIHYDNPLSLNYKHQLIKDASLGGIAYWALGY